MTLYEDLHSSQLFLSLFQLCMTTFGAMAACLGALYYMRRVRLDRPAIGRFNGRDVVILFGFLGILPALYLLLPHWALISLLALTFITALSIGYRPVVSPGLLWLGIGLLIGADLWMGQHMINAVFPWHFVWAENSLVMLLAVIAVANLYIQGGMQLKHVALFAGGLAIYDAIFTLVWPVSSLLLREFVNYPLFPAMGMRIGYDEAIVGLGDLLVYAGFTLAMVKAYGRRLMWLALTLVFVFGAVVPSLSGLVINYLDERADVVIPAQASFGPVALITYLLLRHRYGRERTMKEFLDSDDFVRQAPVPVTEPAVAPEPEVQPAPEPVRT